MRVEKKKKEPFLIQPPNFLSREKSVVLELNPKKNPKKKK